MRKIGIIALWSLVGIFFFSIFVSLFRSCDVSENPKDNSSSTTNEVEDDSIKIDSTKSLNEWLYGATETVTLKMQSDIVLEMVSDCATVLGSQNVTIDGAGNKLTVTGVVGGVIRANEERELHLKNLIISDETTGGVYSDYLGFGGKIRFENCTFDKGIYLKNDIEAVFVNCLFNVQDVQRYSVWVADGSARFDGCTFTGTRALKIHEFDGNDVITVSVNRCIFEDVTEKPGVVIGTLSMETTVSVKNSEFINCNVWDNVGSLEGEDGFFETDTPTNAFNFITGNNTISFYSKPYKIMYYAVVDGKVVDIPETMYKQNGSYPTEYLSENGATIDGLKSYVAITGTEDWEFMGWYLDEQCTQAFDGTIEQGTMRHIVLYAKISRAFWTPNY